MTDSGSVAVSSASPDVAAAPKENLLVLTAKYLPTTSVTIYRDSHAAVVREVPYLDLKVVSPSSSAVPNSHNLVNVNF